LGGGDLGGKVKSRNCDFILIAAKNEVIKSRGKSNKGEFSQVVGQGPVEFLLIFQ
jgi:hypothetical protein